MGMSPELGGQVFRNEKLHEGLVSKSVVAPWIAHEKGAIANIRLQVVNLGCVMGNKMMPNHLCKFAEMTNGLVFTVQFER
jgi:hypothetical protein